MRALGARRGDSLTTALHDDVLAHAESAPETPALASRSVRLTYRDLAERVRLLAAELLADGLTPGSPVLLALPGSPGSAIASLAIQLAGGVPVELGQDPSEQTLSRALETFPFTAAVLSPRNLERRQGTLPLGSLQAVWVVRPPGAPGATLSSGSVRMISDDGTVDQRREGLGALDRRAVDPAGTAVVLFTSGSTGIPHAVAQTYRNIHANTRSIVEYLGLTAADRALLTLPLAYCYGRSVLQTHLHVGGSVVFEERTAYAAVVARTLATERCTGFAGVPLTFDLMRRQVDIESIHFPDLRYVTQAGGAMSRETTDWTRQAFRPAPLFVMYGQTEATARLAYLPPDRAHEKEGSVGMAIPGVELRVVNSEGEELPPGELGELIAQGDNVTAGYLDDRAATAEIIRDGWLWTGDLAVQDDEGFVFLRGRTKEIIKVNGHRISLVEVEQLIAQHPDVADAAVVGMPDPLAGELPVALVVRRLGAAVSDRDLRDHCASALPAWAVPVRFMFVVTLERSPAGKLLRPVLQRIAASAQGGLAVTG